MKNFFKISKYSGTKNSFFIVDSRNADFQKLFSEKFKINRSDFVKMFFSSNHLGMDADGFIFIDNPTKDISDFKWDFYNKDGSSAEMCGNASRCVAIFAKQKLHINKQNIKFESIAGLIETELLSDSKIKVKMPNYKIVPNVIHEQVNLLVNTGVPHAVVSIGEFNLAKMKEEAKKIRKNKIFGEAGTNVTFINLQSFKAITFERGVENFTESCGTGAVAAAIFIAENQKKLTEKTNYELYVPGGSLNIELIPDSNNLIGQAYLTGEVTYHFDLEM